MMKNIFLILMLSSFIIGCQPYVFKVLISKGTSTVSGKPLKVGDQLYKKDTIELKEGAYVGLIHQTGKPLEITKAGKYSVDFWSKKIAHPQLPLEKRDVKIVNPVFPIKVVKPKNNSTPVLFSNVTLYWCPDDTIHSAPNYLITINNLFGEALVSYSSAKNYLELDLQNPLFENEQAVIVEIALKENNRIKSEQFALKKAKTKNDSLIQRFKSKSMDYQELISLGDECVKQGFTFNAFHAYFKALQLSKDSDQKFFGFIQRNISSDSTVLNCLKKE